MLDCGIFYAGPGASAILGDLGAEAIKTEKPGVGDPARKAESTGNITLEIARGRTIFCEGPNRNKKSVMVDLENRKGQRILYRLVKHSDVFLTNMRPQSVEGMSITYPDQDQSKVHLREVFGLWPLEARKG